MVDFLLKNGLLMDVESGYKNSKYDIAVKDGVIVKIASLIETEARNRVDLDGSIVTPGLIDFHAHFFSGGTNTSLEFASYLSTGVTSAVDAGSAGDSNIDSFLRVLSERERRNTRIFLNLSSEGLSCLGDHPENIHPDYMNKNKILRLCRQYSKEIVGLKLRISDEIAAFSHTTSFDSLKKAVEIAEECKLPLSVHIPDFQGNLKELINILRPGDIFCHVFTPCKGILENGKVSEEIFRGREKGILFDCACGKGHFGHETAAKALEMGFLPDFISGDFTRNTFGCLPAASLPHLMNRFMALGLPLETVIKIVTANPARQMGMYGQIGCLREGAKANMAVFRKKEGNVTFKDVRQIRITGKECIVPMATMLEGEWVFNQLCF